MQISKDNQNQINTWQALKDSSGFKLLTDKLEQIIKEQDLVINRLGADFRRAYTDRDIAIVKKDNAMELKELPQRMIEQLSGTGIQPVDNPDAYASANDEDDEEEIDEPSLDEVFKDDLQ